ncbi:MAG: MBOAT family protein [Gemmatimonadetes bacterium]|nr:MBOAT family protein [Gemmatimonadota bacterium]
MLFNSFSYLLFLVVGATVIWLLPRDKRVYLMGLGSILFYGMWRWEFVSLILISAVIDFVATRRILATDVQRHKRNWLLLSLCVNLGLLVFFKYTYFLIDNVGLLGQGIGLNPPVASWRAIDIILPLGISFYTFQTISYTIDAYRGVGRTTDDFFVFLTYVAFWPQLVAGPILRASEMIPQLESPQRASRTDVAAGCQRIVIGLFKKVVIADNLSPIVDTIYAGRIDDYMATDVWVAAILFGFQIYMDFSGYSDIAIGSARMVGVHIPENFDWPYIARSPRDFWRRWHITLSSWIRDYLYLPLTGQRFHSDSQGGLEVAVGESQRRSTWPLFLTWFIMGLWHGAAWRFAVWGVYHAFFIHLYRRVRWLRALPERRPITAWGVTFLVCMLGWVPFRAESLAAAMTMLSKVPNPLLYDLSRKVVYGPHYVTAAIMLVGFLVAHTLHNWQPVAPNHVRVAWAGRVVLTALMTASVLVYLKPVEQFIYFQF